MSRLLNMIFGWEEVLVTQNINQYMKMKNQLNDNGIRSKTEFVNSSGGSMNRASMISTKSITTYYLYTKKVKEV